MTGCRICIYGNSVILGTLGLNLRLHHQCEVTVLIPPFPGKQHLEELKPDVIFFDLEADHPEMAFSMLDSYPGLKLIGISPDTNVVKIWSGKQLKELSTSDLMEVINNE